MSVKVEKNAEKTSGHQVLLVAAADSSEGLPPTIRRCFSHEISMGPLTEEQRAEMLFQSLQSVSGLLSNVCNGASSCVYVYFFIFIFLFLTKSRSSFLYTCLQVRKSNNGIWVFLLTLNNLY